jgi:putative ABC transport system substrate-binding protein
MTVHADPVREGIIASLARPGGQVTGLSDQHGDLAPKRLELLKEVSPSIARVGVLFNPTAPVAGQGQLKDLLQAAPKLGLELVQFPVKGAEDIDRAFAAMAKERVGGITIIGDAVVLGLNRSRIIDLAMKHRLPAIGTVRVWVEQGLLMSYGTDFHDLWLRAATYVDKILKGAKPADLPVEQPTKFELVVNMKTAKALGITIPQTILIRAERVIE